MLLVSSIIVIPGSDLINIILLIIDKYPILR